MNLGLVQAKELFEKIIEARHAKRGTSATADVNSIKGAPMPRWRGKERETS